MRVAALLLLPALAVAAGCRDRAPSPPAAAAASTQAPRDAAHEGVMGPHGDHSPQHGGLVLMDGDVHYEVVLEEDGTHAVWFTDAMRNALPASVASSVGLEIRRPGIEPEIVELSIDESGEAWVATARPVDSVEGVMVTVRYTLRGEQPQQIELPFVPAVAASPR